MNKKIFSVEYEIPGQSATYFQFQSKQSLMDADVLLFCPEFYYNNYNIGNETFQGKINYDEDTSFKILEAIKHWEKELVDFLKSGKNVFIFLSKKEEFFLHTGKKEYSGTGKNRKTTDIVDPHNNYEFLPIDIGNIYQADGKHIEFSGNIIFSNFYKTFKSNLEYKVYLEHHNQSEVIFTGKDKSRVLGLIHQVEKGHIIALPYLSYNKSQFTKHNKSDGKKYWNEKGVQFGNNLINCLLDIDNKLKTDIEKTPTPIWVKNDIFSSKNELKLKQDIKDNKKQIEKINDKNKLLNQKLTKDKFLKDLLFETGKPLEFAVIQALEILGYNAENYNDGTLELDQVITSPEGCRFIGECEGKDSKDINITKFRQLLESLSADFARDEVEEKAFGILFGNPERLKDISKRTLDFTQKCKKGAEREKIALVKTSDLFFVAKYLKENKNDKYKKTCRQAIYDSLGKIVVFPKSPLKSR